MKLHAIACEIIGVDDLALTGKQLEYLEAKIRALPGIEQRALEDANFHNLRNNAIESLRRDEQLKAIISLSVMSYDSLIGVMIDVITGEYADNDYYVEARDDDASNEEEDAAPQGLNYLEALLNAKIAIHHYFSPEMEEFMKQINPAYGIALEIFKTNGLDGEPVWLDLCTTYLPLNGWNTNRELLAWRKQWNPKKQKIRNFGPKRIAEVDAYIRFWFGEAQQQTLSTTVPL